MSSGPRRDLEASKSWHYPTNLLVREYQLEIAKSCLLANTLVILPTGLGKTFIAAVTIYNYSRWYPSGKVVFMAPTRPLVAQQLEATMGLVEVDQKEMAELTGAQIPSEREMLWRERRVFFTTPHVMYNDLATGICPGRDIVLIVLDEAHRATGKYPYCEVARLLEREFRNADLRIVGLTATPAATVSAIQQLIDVLRIAKIESRTEDDVEQYTFRRATEQIIVDPTPDLVEIQRFFEESVIRPHLDQLYKFNAISPVPHISDLQSFRVIKERDMCRTKMQGSSTLGMLEGTFAILISLTASHEILTLHGIIPFFNQLSSSEGESTAIKTRLRNEFERNPTYQKLSGMVKEACNQPGFVSHPKIAHVERILVEHFAQATEVDGTRAIVFAQYRESVMELVRRLSKHSPRLKVMSFVGQSRGLFGSFTQKQQLEVLKRFREGGYNVLVATSIGEEGLDIGNVDLIVCYDMQSSPVRLLQRIGRTGRQRAGRIVLLMSRGREEQRYQQTKSQELFVQRALAEAEKHFKLFPRPSSPIALECVKREFHVKSEPIKGNAATRPSRKKKTQPSLPISFEAFSMEMLAKCPDCDYTKWRLNDKTASSTFVVGHSRRYEQYINLLQSFAEVDDGEIGLPSPSEILGLKMNEPAIKPAASNFEEIMSRWETKFDLHDLEVFLKATLPLLKPTVKLPTSPPPKIQTIDLVQDIPDDFFDTQDIGDQVTGVLRADIRSSPSAENIPAIANQNVNLESRSGEAEITPFVPAIKRRAGRITVLSSSLPSSPVKTKKLKGRQAFDMRQFFDSQAAADENDSGDEDEEGYSELGSFIVDDDEIDEDEGSEDGDENCGSNSSSPDIMSFYRQSLMHSQPIGGFTTESRFLAKKARPPRQYISDISEEEEESLGSCRAGEANQLDNVVDALAGMEWDSLDEFI